jgi:hypothetical protein
LTLVLKAFLNYVSCLVIEPNYLPLKAILIRNELVATVAPDNFTPSNALTIPGGPEGGHYVSGTLINATLLT